MDVAAPRSFLGFIPDDDSGTSATLHLMARIVREYRRDPRFVLLAREITSHLDQKDFAGEAREIQEWVRDAIRYVRDVHEVETLQTPDVTLEIMSGDCDDKAIMAATLLQAIGHPARFVAVGFNDGPFEHVYVETLIGNRYFCVETTEPVEFGWKPSRVTRRMVVHI